MKGIIQGLLIGSTAAIAVFVAADYSLGIPTVKMSYASDSCVEVENYPTVLFGTSKFSCENMPSKFNHVWVK
jgi:hypothetical protein